ncbi:hypothetical protein AAKU64_004383, partial [Undibacterium sp. GrIS 1.8]|uniref:hypothetical protein n=1 Tax=unclassified Undibacterium TaxID=2630295 RepID=UPI00339562AE
PSKMQLASSSRLASQSAKGTLVAVPMENLGLIPTYISLRKKAKPIYILLALIFGFTLLLAKLISYAY